MKVRTVQFLKGVFEVSKTRYFGLPPVAIMAGLGLVMLSVAVATTPRAVAKACSNPGYKDPRVAKKILQKQAAQDEKIRRAKNN